MLVKMWVACELHMLKVLFSLLKTDYLYLQFHWLAEKSAVSLARLENFENLKCFKMVLGGIIVFCIVPKTGLQIVFTRPRRSLVWVLSWSRT